MREENGRTLEVLAKARNKELVEPLTMLSYTLYMVSVGIAHSAYSKRDISTYHVAPE